MRLLQVIQQYAGISRRKAQAAIEAGSVCLNSYVIKTPFVEVDPSKIQALTLAGRPVQLKTAKLGVVKYYKPRGMLCSFKDPHHHHAMGKVLRRPELRGYQIVGRLDRNAEGLLLLTNDGHLLNVLAHPRYEVEKVYHVLVPKVLRYRQTFDAFRQMQSGIMDQGEVLRVVRGKVIKRSNDATTLVFVLSEGKNHEVKRLCRHFSWYVKELKRVEMGGIQLGTMKSGQLKPLTQGELEQLRSLVRMANSHVK